MDRTVDRTADRLACIDAVIAFCDSTDRSDADGQLAVFTDDARMAPMPAMEIVGKENLRGLFAQMGSMGIAQRHLVSNARVSFTGDDTAVVTALLSIFHFGGPGPLVPSMMVNETNEMRRVDGVWLISAKRGELVAGRPPMPAGMGSGPLPTDGSHGPGPGGPGGPGAGPAGPGPGGPGPGGPGPGGPGAPAPAPSRPAARP
jgi:uncharacterized protein (TIGR02246 family)